VAEDSATDRQVVEEATNFYEELQHAPQVTELSSVAAEEMAAGFGRRVQHVATVEDQLRNAVQTVKTLEKQCLKEI
jgi:prophage DNA circulation protein